MCVNFVHRLGGYASTVNPRLVIAAMLIGSVVSAAPHNPDELALQRLRASGDTGFTAQATGPALTVDVSSREIVRQFYLAVYCASDGVPIEWTGSLSTGDAGTTATAFKDAVILRVNALRALAGVPAGITLNSTYSSKAQQAALMMSANNALSHTPPSSWTFYTAEGASAAGNSNLYLGENGPAAITGYIADPGANNSAAGHRRWLLYPQTKQMGTGDVPETGSFKSANAIWVIDAAFGSARPATRTSYVAWPYAGYVPANLIFPRWSFSYPGANFTNATVAMTRGGSNVPVQLEPVTANVGEETLVWVYNDLDSNNASPLTVIADTTFHVTVSNVLINGSVQSFTYDVIAFDPNVAGSDVAPVTITGSSAPVVGTASTYSAARPIYADTLQWRTLQFDNNIPTYNAESDLSGLIATTTGTYGGRSTATRGAGTASYQFAMPTFADQYLTSPDTFFAPAGASPQITFLSRLGWATTGQTARVQVSVDDGVSWRDLYSQVGTGSAGETSFATRTISLASVAGYTFRIRFAYTWTPAMSVYNNTDAGVGWFFDNVTLSGVQHLSSASSVTSTSSSTFSFTPDSTNTLGLQARGEFFGTYAMSWGPVFNLAPVAPSTSSDGARIINLSVRANAGAGDQTLIAGFVVTGNGSKNFAVRGVGPTLLSYGVTNAVPDPKLELYEKPPTGSPVSRGTNDDWGSGTTPASTLRSTFSALGAAALVEGSKDAALLSNLSAGVFSAQVVTSSNGVALAEIYDTATLSGSRLANISGRAPITPGDGALIAGFVLSGTKTVLIRGVGPTLSSYGVNGALADPRLEVVKVDGGSQSTWANDNWETSSTPKSTLTATFGTVGAFSLNDGSKDAALLLTLPAGVYSAKVTGPDGASGVGLVEVYEVP